MSSVEFERAEIERPLGLVDRRLRERGVAASVYAVGGAAIAVTVYDAQRTLDVDAVVSDKTVLDDTSSRGDRIRTCGRAMASSLNLPASLLATGRPVFDLRPRWRIVPR